MINITHSIWWIAFVLLPLTFWMFIDSSIWAIVLSIFLWQAMDMDLEKSWISKKKGFRSLSKLVQFWSDWHREQTHSIFFCLLIALVTSPLSLYLAIVDNSNFISNIFVIFLWVFSHWFLDMFNKKPIPLFYIPKINPISKAKYYTWWNFLWVFSENLSDYFINESKRYRSPGLWKIWQKLKRYSDKLKFDIWLTVSSEWEFRLVTLPLLGIFILLVIFNWEVLFDKITDSNNLLVHNVLFWIFIILYWVVGNYLFINNWWLKDFFITAFKEQGVNNWKWDDLKKLLWETNFTKIIIILILFLSTYYNADSYINNYWDFFGRLGLIFSELKEGDGTLIERILNFLKDILTYLIF